MSAGLAALVLAAGRGERLRPLTDTTPKPLLDVGGTTLLDAALARVAQVVPLTRDDVAVNAHWLADRITAHVDGRVHVSVEPQQALGTAGAVGALLPWLRDRDLLVVNGDAWWQPEIDLRPFVAEWDRRRPRLVVVADRERADFDGRWRFAGVSLLPNALARALRPDPSGLYERVWRGADVELVAVEATFVDCGTPQDLQRARQLAAKRP